MGATVTPIRLGVGIVVEPVVLKPSEPAPQPCPVCGVMIESRAFYFWHCDCGAWIHGECYWGRVASMAEWLEYLRQLSRDDLPDDYCPDVLCPACRATEGA